MPSVGVDPTQSSFTMPDKNGDLETLSQDEVLKLVRKELQRRE